MVCYQANLAWLHVAGRKHVDRKTYILMVPWLSSSILVWRLMLCVDATDVKDGCEWSFGWGGCSSFFIPYRGKSGIRRFLARTIKFLTTLRKRLKMLLLTSHFAIKIHVIYPIGVPRSWYLLSSTLILNGVNTTLPIWTVSCFGVQEPRVNLGTIDGCHATIWDTIVWWDCIPCPWSGKWGKSGFSQVRSDRDARACKCRRTCRMASLVLVSSIWYQ